MTQDLVSKSNYSILVWEISYLRNWGGVELGLLPCFLAHRQKVDSDSVHMEKPNSQVYIWNLCCSFQTAFLASPHSLLTIWGTALYFCIVAHAAFHKGADEWGRGKAAVRRRAHFRGTEHLMCDTQCTRRLEYKWKSIFLHSYFWHLLIESAFGKLQFYLCTLGAGERLYINLLKLFVWMWSKWEPISDGAAPTGSPNYPIGQGDPILSRPI